MGTMLLEGSSRRKFAQFMPNHIFSHKHRVEQLAVMHQESVTHKIRRDHRPARPCLDRPPGAADSVHLLDLLDQLYVHEWTLFYRSGHKLPRLFPALPAFDDDRVARLMFTASFKSL